MNITLPEPPSANRYWRHVGTKVLLSAAARQYRQDVLAQWLQRPLRDRQRADGPLIVSLRWYRSAKRGDLDNRIKQALDALKQCAYHDDNQIVEIHAYRGEDPKHPRLEVSVIAALSSSGRGLESRQSLLKSELAFRPS